MSSIMAGSRLIKSDAACGNIVALCDLRSSPVAVFVARIAGHTVVRIPTHIGVREIGRVIVPVATRALECYIGRCGTRMAVRTNAVCIAVSQGEVSMCERSSQPIGRGVAGRARRWGDPDCGGVAHHVIGHRSPQIRSHLPCRRMATVAIKRRLGRGDVAKIACRCYVSAGQGEAGGGMIESGVEPIRHVVA